MNKWYDASNAGPGAENNRISSLYRGFIIVCVRHSSTFLTKDHYIFYHARCVRGTQEISARIFNGDRFSESLFWPVSILVIFTADARFTNSGIQRRSNVEQFQYQRIVCKIALQILDSLSYTIYLCSRALGLKAARPSAPDDRVSCIQDIVYKIYKAKAL